MKAALEPATGSNAVPLGPVNIPMVNTISLEPDESTAVMGDKSTVCIATVNNDDGTVMYEHVGTDVAEKRRWSSIEPSEHGAKRPRPPTAKSDFPESGSA